MKLNYFSSAFDKALKNHAITGKALSEKSGISQNHISQFRKGENITVEALSKLIEAMEQIAPGSVSYFLKLVGEESAAVNPKFVSFRQSLEALIESATDEEIEGVMLAIARKWKSRNNKELCA